MLTVLSNHLVSLRRPTCKMSRVSVILPGPPAHHSSNNSGSSVRVMRKAKVSVHRADVQRVLSAYSIEVPANSVDDLAEVSVADQLNLTSAVPSGLSLNFLRAD